MQYKIPLMLRFRYVVKFMKTRYSGIVQITIRGYRASETPAGAVSIKNVTETVTTIAVPLVVRFNEGLIGGFCRMIRFAFTFCSH